MKRSLALLALLFPLQVGAHSLWVEPATGGYKVFYGEPGEAEPEKGEKLDAFVGLEAWDANGAELTTRREADHYFISTDSPSIRLRSLEGLYYGKEGKGTLYVQHARYLGVSEVAQGSLFLDLKPVKGKPGVFGARKNGKPWAGAELTLHAPGGWSRSEKADAKGRLKLEFPWAGRYILSAYWKEEKIGKKGTEAYQAVGHMSSLCFHRP